jgi:uncharacterized membrane protein
MTQQPSQANFPSSHRIDLLDLWRGLAVVLMVVYHFLYDLALFGKLSWTALFSTPLGVMQKIICCSFILLAGASARFSRNNMRHALVVLLAGVAVEVGAAIGGQTIRFGILQLLGVSMVLYHFSGKYLQKLPGCLLAALGGALFALTAWWTGAVQVTVSWLYPLGFMGPGFSSADYFPLFPWHFLFLMGTALGGWCLVHRDQPPLNTRLPRALTFPGRHSLLIYLLHQPVLYGLCVLLWG